MQLQPKYLSHYIVSFSVHTNRKLESGVGTSTSAVLNPYPFLHSYFSLFHLSSSGIFYILLIYFTVDLPTFMECGTYEGKYFCFIYHCYIFIAQNSGQLILIFQEMYMFFKYKRLGLEIWAEIVTWPDRFLGGWESTM